MRALKTAIQERKFLAYWGGGCSLDIGATIDQNCKNEEFYFLGVRDNKTNSYFHNKKYLDKIKAKKS